MECKTITLTAALVFASSAALATPQYSGNTFGAEPAYTAPGYYLWNNESSPNDWSLRWSAPGAEGDTVEWSGNIVFQDSNLGSVSIYLFESSGPHVDSLHISYNDPWLSGGDGFRWTAATNNSGDVDGIDFSLTIDRELMEISLGSSLFSDLTLDTSDPGVESEMIYIGSGLASTNVLTYENGGMVYQQFEIVVPEPGTLALLGIGLAGLGLARRRVTRSA